MVSLLSFKLACNENGIYEGAAMGLLPFFMKNQSAAMLNSRICLEAKSWHKRQKEETLTIYCEVVTNSGNVLH